MESFENEEWRVVDGFPMYRVSNLGRICSVYGSERILKKQVGKHGYETIFLCNDGYQKNARVHRIVCTAFLPNPNGFDQVNHKNGIKTDNRVANLEWCSGSRNIQHGFENELIGTAGEGSYCSKLTYENVRLIREMFRDNIPLRVIKNKLELNASITAISFAARGKTWNWGEDITGPPVEQSLRVDGEFHHSSVLNEEIVATIRLEVANGVSYSELGRRFGVSASTISSAARGVTWRALNKKHPPCLVN